MRYVGTLFAILAFMAICLMINCSDNVDAQSDDSSSLFEYDTPTFDSDILFRLASPTDSIELYEIGNLKYWVKEYNGQYYAQLTNIGVVTEGQTVVVPKYINYNGKECKVVSVGLIFQPFVLTNYSLDAYIGHIGFTDNFNNQVTPQNPGGLGGIGPSSVFANEPVHYSLVFQGSVSVKDYAFGEFNLFRGAGSGYCFYNQCGLTSVIFNEGVTSIGKWAFAYSSLNNIVIPEMVVSVGEGAFYSSTLQSVTWNASANIPDYAFTQSNLGGGVNKISYLTINGSPSEIGEYAFSACGITSLELPDCVVKLGHHAFSNSKQLQHVSIGTGITAIPGGCFIGCTNLTELCSRGSVKEIGNSAFYQVPLQSFDFSSVESIGTYAFFGSFTGEDIVTFDLRNVKYIGDYAFCACTSPLNLHITSLEFVGQSGLAMSGELLDGEIVLPNNCVVSEAAFASLKATKIIFGDECTIGTKALANCTSLETVVFGDNCTLEDSFYSDSIFKGSTLRSVTIPSTIIIGKNAFQFCESLETVVFEGERSRIGEWFYGCRNLTNITFPDGLVYIDDYAFYGCSKLDISDVPLNVTVGDVLSWGVRAFEGTASITKDSLFGNEFDGTISFLNVTLVKGGVSTKYSFMTDISGSNNSMQLDEPFAYYYTMPTNLGGIYDSALMEPLPGLKFPNNLYLVDDEKGTSSFAIYDRTEARVLL